MDRTTDPAHWYEWFRSAKLSDLVGKREQYGNDLRDAGDWCCATCPVCYASQLFYGGNYVCPNLWTRDDVSARVLKNMPKTASDKRETHEFADMTRGLELRRRRRCG
jgi:hypothetical protein